MSEEKKDNNKKDDGEARKETFTRTIKDLIQKGEEKKENK